MGSWIFEGSRFAGIISLDEQRDLYLKFVAPRREMLDAAKESKALISMIEARLISRPQAIQEMGFDYEDVMREIETDNDRQKDIGPDALEVQQISVTENSSNEREDDNNE